MTAAASASSTSWLTFAGLHYKYRPASIVIRDFEQRTISNSVPQEPLEPRLSGQFSSLFILINMFVLYVVATVASNNSSHMHIYVIINFAMVFLD